MNTNITIGGKIKDLRKYHSITQNALASYLGVSSQAISKWENSVSMPDLCLIPDIATYFGITIDELFSFNPNKNPRCKQRGIRERTGDYKERSRAAGY